MADTLVKKPKLIVGTQAQVKSEMGENDIGFATDVEFYTKAEVDEQLADTVAYIDKEDRKLNGYINQNDANIQTIAGWVNAKDSEGNRATLETEAQDAYRAINELNAKISEGGGASLPILMRMWSDHVINDMSWLRADTFSWQSGDTYKSAYEHLVADSKSGIKYYAWARTFDGEISYTTTETPKTNDITYYKDTDGEFKTYRKVMEVGTDSIYDSASYELVRDSSKDETAPQKKTDTIGDITITYYLADDGHKICLPDQESNIVALYEKTGAADYYLLDTENKQFKLPRKQKRTLIQAVKNTDGTWYNLYSDGWVEQGGTATSGSSSVAFPVEFADNMYYFNANLTSGGSGSTGHIISSGYGTTGCTLKEGQYQTPQRALTNNAKWIASGYAAESAYASAGVRLEYYYVGNFEQSAIEQTAGLNAELFNGKADRNLLNTTDNVDIVVESQLPTVENGYTWYRLYKSGWLEAGGKLSGRETTFPRAFVAPPTVTISTSDTATICVVTTNVYNITTTGFSGHRAQIADTWHNWVVDMAGMWVAYGMSAE